MKQNYAIIADMSSDLSDAMMERFHVDARIKGYMSTPYAENIECDYHMTEADLDAFYAALKANKKGYKTSSLSVVDAVSCMEPFLAEGRDIIVSCLSSALSSTYAILLNTQKTLCAKYPGRRIFIIDSGRYSLANGLLIIKACELRDKGLSVEENALELEKAKHTLHQMGSVDDLFYIASKGRITHAKAFFGTIAGVKALGDFGPEGMVTVLAKVCGFKKEKRVIVEYIKQTIKNAEEQMIIIGQSVRSDQAKEVAALIREEIKPREVMVCNVYTMSAINIGPGILGVYYFGTEITDLKFEKETITRIIANLP